MPRNSSDHSLPVLRRRKALAVFFASLLFCAFFFAHPASAQGLSTASQNINSVAQTAGVPNANADLLTVIGRIINIALGFLGVLLLGLILYAGFLWMTAGGDATKVETAKKYIRNAIIGLIIIACAWAIVRFILGLFGGIGGGGINPGNNPPGGGFSTTAGSLGGGIIESHYPPRNAVGVPRNAAIIVTFKKPIKLSSIIQDYNDKGTPADLTDDTVTTGLNDAVIRIYQTSASVDNRLKSDQVRVRFTADRKTFVFRPVNLLGSATENVGYTVALMPGLSGVLLEDGSAAFTGSFGQGYSWNFETSTLVDTTPPHVVSAFPRQGTLADRNAIVNIQFNEAIDPTSATGYVKNAFTNIEAHAGGVNTAPLDGEYRISNQYKSIEFIPSLPCGKNTCGTDMYCLPDGAPQMDVIAHAATLDGQGPQAQFLAAGFDGVTDVAGNSLDGNADGITQGRGADDYAWRFGLTNNINLQAPIVEATLPPAQESDPGRENVDPFAPIHARFDSLLRPSSFNTDNAMITPHESATYADTFWWTTGLSDLTDANAPVGTPTDVPAKSDATIDHRQFATSTLYDPFLYSGIQNVYQNCFNPASSKTCNGSPNCCSDMTSAQDCTFTGN
jgi:hypothetical protein